MNVFIIFWGIFMVSVWVKEMFILKSEGTVCTCLLFCRVDWHFDFCVTQSQTEQMMIMSTILHRHFINLLHLTTIKPNVYLSAIHVDRRKLGSVLSLFTEKSWEMIMSIAISKQTGLIELQTFIITTGNVFDWFTEWMIDWLIDWILY